MQSQVNWHGYDPKEAMIVMAPREVSDNRSPHLPPPVTNSYPQGEHFWRTEDVVKLIEEQGDSVALVWLPGESSISYVTVLGSSISLYL